MTPNIPPPQAPLPPPTLADARAGTATLPKPKQFGGTWLTQDGVGASGGLANKQLLGQ
jgi:hypothetical protein